MAVVVTLDTDPVTGSKQRSTGDHFRVQGTMAFTVNTYPTNGEPITKTTFGFEGRLIDVIVTPGTGTAFGQFDKANSKIKLFTGDGVEAVNNTNAAETIRFEASGV